MQHRLGILLFLAASAGCRDDAGHVDADESGTTDDPGSSSGAGSADTTGAETGSTGDVDEPPAVVPAPGGLRRLRADQYIGTIGVLLGGTAAKAASPPADQSVLGFDSVGGVSVALSPAAIEQYERSAIEVAQATIEQPYTLAELVPCVTEGPQDEGCYVQVAETLGRAAWRRPITVDENHRLVEVARVARQLNYNSFEIGLKYEIAMILESPAFIYAVELGEDEGDGRRRLTTDEWVTRASLFVLGRAPGAETFARIDAGQLDGPDAPRMLAQEWMTQGDARTAVGRYFDELLRVREVEQRSKDAELFPLFAPAAGSMRAETLMLVDDVVFGESRDLRRIFDADYTFANAELGAIYGLDVAGSEMRRVGLPADQGRLGVLSQPAVLAVGAHNDRNSPTRRGLFVQRTLLCNDVPPPPGDIDTNLPEPPEPTTLRSRLEGHLGAEMCVSCHAQTDPVGFAFEHFDASGVWRELDAGFPIDASGDIAGFGAFDGGGELALLVRDDPRLAPCMVRNLYRHALGRPEDDGTADALAWLTERFSEGEFDLQDLIVDLVANPAFLHVSAPQKRKATTMRLLRKPTISRRTMLRGAMAGASFAIGLPLLEAMLDTHGEALAGGEPLPRRFVTWLVSNGFLLDRFEPEGTGANWSLSEQLDPFSGVKSYLNVCTGYANHGADEGLVSGHLEGMTVFNGYRLQFAGFGYDSGGPTVDQLVADAIGTTTPVRSLQVAVSKANFFAGSGGLGTAISFRGQPGGLTALPGISSPKQVWQSLFGIFPADDAPEDDRLVRQMMLDGVRAQTEALRDRVGAADRVRIDAHLQGVHELNQKISALLPSCVMPVEPSEENLEPVGSENIGLVSRRMSELIAYALRCDITRVASVNFLGLAGETPYPEAGVTATKHLLSHEAQYNATALQHLNTAIVFEMQRLAEFAEILRDSEDVGGNLLDSTIVYASSDCSVGWLHSVARQPVILIGTGGGHLRYPGIHSQAVENNPNDPNGLASPNMPTAGNTSDIALACLQGYDPGATSFGGGVCESTTPLAEILA